MIRYKNGEIVEDIYGNIYIVRKKGVFPNFKDYFDNGVNELELFEIKGGIKKLA